MGRLVMICAAALVLGGLSGCHEGDEHDPCTDVDCSDHGVCLDEAGRAYCLCDPGFHAAGLECLANATDGDADLDGDADGDAVGDADGDVDADVDADADSVSFDLSVVLDGGGTGTVVSSPDGIDCGATCAATFDAGTTITLTATADAGSDFVGWTGAGCSTGPTCVFAHDGSDLEVTATFELQEHDLDVTLGGDGSGEVVSSPAGIDCEPDCTATFVHGTSVTLTAAETGGSSFGGWGGDCSGLSDTCVLDMDRDRSATASFDFDAFTLAVSIAGTGGGAVTSDDSAIDCPGLCAASHAWGSDVELFAAADATSDFVGWSGACSGTGACTVTVTAASSVTATFTRRRHTLTVARAGSGDGSVSSTPPGISCGIDCAEEYDEGTTVSLVQSTIGGAVFMGWSGACSGTTGCSVSMTAARSVTATFCQPRVCGPLECGTVSNGCGGTMSCGTCCDLGTHRCVDPAPAGWSGPVIRHDRAGGTAAPLCTAAYPTLVDDLGHALSAGGTCSCDCAPATGTTCGSVTIEEHNTGTCTAFTPDELTIAPGTCASLPAAMRNSGQYYHFDDPRITGGSCAPSVVDGLSDPVFDTESRLCGGAVASSGVCTTAGDVCWPNAESVFDDRLCIWRSGDNPCPGGDYSARTFVHTGYGDTRTCGGCSCGAPAGDCGWSVTYESGSCAAPVWIASGDAGDCIHASGATLARFSGGGPGGTCAASSGTMTGSAYPTGPVTVCCQP